MNVRKLTLCELKDKFMKGEVSAVEIVKAYFQRILLVESKVKASRGIVTDRLRFAFPIPHTFDFHRKERVDVPVTLFRIECRPQTVKSGGPHRAAV